MSEKAKSIVFETPVGAVEIVPRDDIGPDCFAIVQGANVVKVGPCAFGRAIADQYEQAHEQLTKFDQEFRKP